MQSRNVWKHLFVVVMCDVRDGAGKRLQMMCFCPRLNLQTRTDFPKNSFSFSFHFDAIFFPLKLVLLLKFCMDERVKLA